MKRRKAITDSICLLMMFFFFYDGIYKIANILPFGIWLYHAPLLSGFSAILKYAVPTLELVLSLMLLTRYKRLSLSGIILANVLFVLWVMAAFLFTNRLFWPFHALWHKPKWLQEIALALFWSWLAFIALALPEDMAAPKSTLSSKLRNTPAKASWRGEGSLLPRK